MGDRSLLHRNKLAYFKEYLGDRLLKTKGDWEVARWKRENGRMCFIYDRNRGDHLTVSDYGCRDVYDFIKEFKARESTNPPPREWSKEDIFQHFLKEKGITGTELLYAKHSDNIVHGYMKWLETQVHGCVTMGLLVLIETVKEKTDE